MAYISISLSSHIDRQLGAPRLHVGEGYQSLEALSSFPFSLDRKKGLSSFMALLRSWVQIPPGPFLSVTKLRYCIEIVFSFCRTNWAATHALFPIQLFHSHNVNRPSPVVVCDSFIPTSIMPFNVTSMPLVALVFITAITTPLLSPVVVSGCRSIS